MRVVHLTPWQQGLAVALIASLTLVACTAPVPPSCTGGDRQPVNHGITNVR